MATRENEPIARIVVDVGTRCIAIYLGDSRGNVVEDEWFRIPQEFTPGEPSISPFVIFGMLYDYFNALLNVDPEESAHAILKSPGGLRMPTENEITKFGASLSWLDQIKLFQEWLPLVSFGQRFMLDPDEYTRTIIVAEACEWVAHKTQTGLDDQVVTLIASIMKTRQGEALVRFLLAQIPNGDT